MKQLFESFDIKGTAIRNRIGVPPMVCFSWSDDTGRVSEKNIAHYTAIAQGGAGLIIQEATCIHKDGRVCDSQLGVWEDAQVQGLKEIARNVHEQGVPIIMQIHHAGIVGLTETTPGPSDYEFFFIFDQSDKKGREMSLSEIRAMQDDFVAAARRAYEAGYDGVELHACHNYLISQFMNSRVNRRTDAYGREPELFATEVIERIKKELPESFITGVRLGIFEPTLEDGIRHAQKMEKSGADFLNVSFGFLAESEPQKPEEYPFNELIFGAQEIKKNVGIPVFAVSGIDSGEMARDIIEKTGVDMVCVGAGTLVNYNWARDAEAGRDVGKCLRCAVCQWRVVPERCPGKKKFEKSLQ